MMPKSANSDTISKCDGSAFTESRHTRRCGLWWLAIGSQSWLSCLLSVSHLFSLICLWTNLNLHLIRNQHEEFERCFANYDLNQVAKNPGRRVNADYIPGALRYLGGLLFREAERLDSQRWTLIPIGKLQISFVPICVKVLYWVCRLAHEDPNVEFHAPPALMVSQIYV